MKALNLLTLTTGIVLLAIAAGCGGRDGGGSASDGAIVDDLAKAVTRPGAAFHVNVTFASGAQAQASNLTGEIWISSDGKASRFELGNEAGGLDRISITVGGMVSAYTLGLVQTFPANESGRVSDPALHALSYLRTLSFAPIIEQESGTLDGQPVLIVEGKGLGDADGDAGCALSMRVFVEADSLLPLKEEEVADCGSGPVVEQVITYEDVEFLPVQSLPPGTFDPDTLRDQALASQLSRAKQFGFPVHSLGQSQGLELMHIEIQKAAVTGQPLVTFLYSPPQFSDQPSLGPLTIAQGHSGAFLARTCDSPSTPKAVTLDDGTKAELCTGVSRSLSFTRAGSAVYIAATSIGDGQGNETNPFNSEDPLISVANSIELIP